MSTREHWQQVYEHKADSDLSWYQDRPAVSLAFIDSLKPVPRRAIDIGGGQSLLAGTLIDRGVEAVTVVDLSAAALDRSRARLAQPSDRIRWVAGDVLALPDLGPFDLWHDRAVFHFFTDAEDRRRYIQTAAATVSPHGHAIIATFAPTGPEKCSGLPVCRYDAEALAAMFAPSFLLVGSRTEAHATPWGKPQDFVYVLLRRNYA